MSWTALLPFKPAGERKTRLAGRLSREERALLAETLFGHVTSILGRSAGVSAVCLLARSRPADWPGSWIEDRGRGLNDELAAAREALGRGPLIVLHADLPLLDADDIAALIEAGRDGCAIAPDRHGSGTNALAIGDGRAFDFRFGRDSFRLHREQDEGRIGVVTRPGLALDIDTPDDLDAALAGGFVLPLPQ